MKQFMSVGLICILCCFYACNKTGQNATLNSPDGTITVQTGIEEGRIYYTVSKNNSVVIGKSFLGFILKDGDFSQGFTIRDVAQSSFSETWEQPWGEELSVDNTYNQMVVDVAENGGLQRRFSVIFSGF